MFNETVSDFSFIFSMFYYITPEMFIHRTTVSPQKTYTEHRWPIGLRAWFLKTYKVINSCINLRVEIEQKRSTVNGFRISTECIQLRQWAVPKTVTLTHLRRPDSVTYSDFTMQSGLYKGYKHLSEVTRKIHNENFLRRVLLRCLCSCLRN